MAEWDGRGLVSTEWLAANLSDPRLRIFDVTVHLRPATPGPYQIESGQADYEAAHVPGAGFLDLARDLSDPHSPLSFTMPPVGDFAAALGAAGVARGDRVVAYTTTTPMWATRLWWMLRACGFDDTAVLDGGLAKWTAEGRPTEAGEHRYPPAELTLAARPGAWADKAAVLDLGANLQLQPARSQGFAGDVPRVARKQRGALKVSPEGLVGQLWHALRAGERNRCARRSHVCRA